MRRKRTLLIALPVLILAALGLWFVWGATQDPVPFGEPTPPPEGPGWIDLLDEDDAGAWANTTDDEDLFEIVHGVLHIFGHSSIKLRYVGYTAERFGDFDLHIEYRVTKGANSGVFLRAQPNDPVHRGFEVQILDDHGKPPHKNRSGAIYDVATPMYNLSRPAGEWNSYDIRVHGGEVEIVMNGWRVIHTDLEQMTMPIGKYNAPFAELPREGALGCGTW